MKKTEEKIPIITFFFLLFLLVFLLALPTTVMSGEIVRCSSGSCTCVCGDKSACSCGAYEGTCWCICVNPDDEEHCPEDGGGGGDPWIPPYWY